MNRIQNTPIRSAVSQENAVVFGNIKPAAGFSLKAQQLENGTALSSRKKGLSQLSNQLLNTPSARRKLGNVSNTPIGSLKLANTNGTLKKPQSSLARKEDSFVKPLFCGPTTELPEKMVCISSLPTVYEDIENMHPQDFKQLRDDYDPITVGLWDIPDVHNVPFDSDEESQKENSDDGTGSDAKASRAASSSPRQKRYKSLKMECRLMTVDELCDLL